MTIMSCTILSIAKLLHLPSSSYRVCNGAHPSHRSTLHFCDVVFARYLAEMCAVRHTAPSAVNVADAVSIGDNILGVFCRSLPPGFHAKISSPVKTMEYLKRGINLRENCVRCRVYLAAHSDGGTTTAASTGADLLLSIVCGTSIVG